MWERRTTIPYIAWDIAAITLRDDSFPVAGGWIVVPSPQVPGSKPRLINTAYRHFPGEWP